MVSTSCNLVATGKTTMTNQLTAVAVAVGHFSGQQQPVVVAFGPKIGQKPDPTGPENSTF
jgi:hypothetical protein